MPNDHLITPLWSSLNTHSTEHAQNKNQISPQLLPCHVVKVIGELVTVAFDVQSKFTLPQTLMPQAFSAYVRGPTQVGDKGMALSADYYLGGNSGIGGGTANTYNRGNLSRLVFLPVSQKAFGTNPTRNLNAVFINGPQGVVLQTTDGACKFTLGTTGLTITIGGVTVTIDGSGLTVTGGDIVNNGLTVGSTHVHSGIVIGADNTGPPNP